jgi:hypothetical protein
MRHSHGQPGPDGSFWDRDMTPMDDDALIDLQIEVLDALETADHPQFAAANSDRALRDGASASERKAWLAVYGPLTGVTI